MADNVIRQDMVQVTYDFDDSSFKKIVDLINDFTKSFNQAMNGTQTDINSLSNGLDEIVSNFGDVNNAINNIDSSEISELENILDETTDAINDSTENFEDMRREIDRIGDNGLGDLPDDVDSAADSAKDFMSILKSNLPKPLYNCLQSVSGVMDKLIDKAIKFTAQLAKKAVDTTKKLAGGIAKGVTVSTAAAGGIVAKSIMTGMDFESGMSQVAATMGIDNTSEDFQMMSTTAKEMGRSTQFSATQSAEALNYLALAGYSAEQACEALPTVLDLAAAGGMELAATSDMITDSMSALGIEATQENLTEFGDKMAKASQKSNTSVAQLGEAILTVGGTAKNLAGGTTELNTLLGILADNGIKGAEGGTALRNVMLSLQDPTDIASKAMSKLGLEVYDSQGKMRPMNDILNDLNASMENMTDAEKNNIISTIFNKNDLKSINALLDNSGDRFDELSSAIENSDGAMRNMAETMNDNLKGKITSFKSALEGVQIAIFESLGSGNLKGVVEEATGWLGELTTAVENDGMQGFVKAVGSIFAKVIAKIAESAPTIIQAGIDIINNLIIGIQENKDTIMNSILYVGKTLINGILQIMPQVLDLGITLIRTLITGIINNKDEILQLALNIGIEFIDAVCKVFNGEGASTAQLEQFGDIFHGIVDAIKGVVDFISTNIKPIAGVIMGIVTAFLLWKTATLGINTVLKINEGIMKAKEVASILLAAKEKLLNSAIWKSIPPLAAQAAALLANPITWIVLAVIALIAAIVLLIKNWDKIKPAIAAVWNSIKETFGKVAEWFKTNVINPVVNFFKGIFEKMINNAAKTINTIKQIGSSIINWIVNLFSSLWDKIVSIVTSIFEWIINNNIRTINAIKEIASNVINWIVNFFTSLWDKITSVVSGIFEFISTTMGNIFTAISDTWKSIVDNVSSFLGDIWDGITNKFNEIVEWLTGLKDKFIETGKNIIGGLISGITSKISEITTEVKNIGNSVLNGVKGFFDIHSPSREMFKLGQFIGEGLNCGIKDTKEDLESTAFSISGSIEDNISPFSGTNNNSTVSDNNFIPPIVRTPENSSSISTSSYNENNNYSPVLNLEINGTNLSTRELKRLIKESFKEFAVEANESFLRRNPRLTRV